MSAVRGALSSDVRVSAANALLTGLIDYAGLFPPAALPMARAVAAYAAGRRSAERGMLARFVVPVARLDEFAGALAALSPEERGPGPWEISALLGADAVAEARAAVSFNRAHATMGVIRSLEARVDSAARIQAVRTAVPKAFELFCEVPPGDDPRWLLAAVRAAGARAKVRTGGVTPAEIPSPDAVLGFLEGCAAIRLPFKATAGLHHALRAERALTYEAGCPRATMFGYLNVLLAATALWLRRPRAEARRLLVAEDAAALVLGGDGLTWGESAFTTAELEKARREFVLSVGSCSFTEPVEDIRALGAGGPRAGEREGET